MKDNQPPKEFRTLKKGTIREDGMIFANYCKGSASGERWISADKFKAMIKRDRELWDKRKPPSARQLEIREKKKELSPLEFKRWKKSTRPSTHKQKTDPIEIQKARDRAKRNRERIKNDPIAWEKYKIRKAKAAKKRYERRKNNPKVIIERSLRSRLAKRLKSKGTDFTFTYCEMLGCTPDEAQRHIEKQFTKKMSWDNYATYWEIDHIRPLSSFNLEIREEYLACNHYTNLQPMSKKQNNKKSNTWDGQTDMLSKIL